MKLPAYIDRSHRLLHRLGWSVGEACFQMPNGSRYWQVDASRDGQVILASAHSQAMAWWGVLPAGSSRSEGRRVNQTAKSFVTRSAVVFDMDGVLVDSEPIINAAAIRALAEYGVQARPEDFVPFIGAGDDRYVGGVAQLYGKTYAPEMKLRTYDWYMKLLPTMGKAFPGARELFEMLRQEGVPYAVASSSDRVKVEANLTQVLQVPLASFKAIVVGEDIVRKKPHPEIFLEAARRMGVQPVSCCVVEDAINGVEAAKAAGMYCVAVTTSFCREALAATGADLVRSKLSDLSLRDLLGREVC